MTSGTKYTDFGYSKGDYIPFDSFQVFSMVSHIMGKHSLEFGSDLRLLKEYTFRYGNPSGLYQFSLNGGQGWTNGPNDNSSAGSITATSNASRRTEVVTSSFSPATNAHQFLRLGVTLTP